MRTRGAATAFAVLILILTSLTLAKANNGAVQERLTQASTIFWSVSPAPRGGTPQNSPLIITWTVVTNTAYGYFDAVNTGPGPLTRLSLGATSVAESQNPNNAALTFELCQNGTWNPLDNSCSGNVLSLGGYVGPNTLNLTIIQTLGVGQRLALRATTPQNRRNDLTTSISFSVSRDGATAQTTTGS